MSTQVQSQVQMKADRKADRKAEKKALKKALKAEKLNTESESEKSDSDSKTDIENVEKSDSKTDTEKKIDKPKSNQIAKMALFLTELQKKNPSNTDILYAEIMKEIGFTSRAIPSKWGGKKERKSGNRSKTAYNFFVGSESVRNEIKEKYENMPVSKTMKIIGEMWKKLNEEDKQKYVDMATEDRKNFKSEKSENSEEKSANGYQMYCSEFRESIRNKNPNVGGREITKLLSVEWKKLDDDAKGIYLKKATEINFNNPKTKKDKKMSKTDSAKSDEDHILNPETSRMVAKNSKLGKVLMQKTREEKAAKVVQQSDSDSDSEPETPVKKSIKTEAPKAPKKEIPKVEEPFNLGSDSDSDSDSEVEVAMKRKKKIAMKAKKHVLTDSEEEANDSSSDDSSSDDE